MHNIQKLYQGCINTPNLWFNDAVLGLQQFELTKQNKVFNNTIEKQLRLGKLVERFICFQLQQSEGISVLAENIQIQKDKITLGELDCIITQDHQPIHLEIIYKFYLYDRSVDTTELEHFIGPNRKDSLMQKLHKLKEKQLPLLQNLHTKSLLDSLQLPLESMQQKVCFKAQLFLPLQQKTINLKFTNKACIKGFYIKRNELDFFNHCKFYLPKKLDWLLEIHLQADWVIYDYFLEVINPILDNQTAPLCWVKKPNGETLKCFIVWW